jgi:hypothetical protein
MHCPAEYKGESYGVAYAIFAFCVCFCFLEYHRTLCLDFLIQKYKTNLDFFDSNSFVWPIWLVALWNFGYFCIEVFLAALLYSNINRKLE